MLQFHGMDLRLKIGAIVTDAQTEPNGKTKVIAGRLCGKKRGLGRDGL